MKDELKHAGVKGMKWGVIRKRETSTGAKPKGQNGNKLTSRIKEEVGSIKREHSWKKVAGDISKMSTKDINKLSQRIQMENDLKRLAKSSKDKQGYRNRGKMSNEELSRKVTRLRAQDALQRNISNANKSQVELGKKIVGTAGSLVVKKAIKGSIDTDDVVKAWKNSNKTLKDDIIKLATDRK